LTQAGASREDSYRLVQRNAMKVWESDGALSLLDLLRADADVTALLPVAELEALFDLDYHYRQVDAIFERVFDRNRARNYGRSARAYKGQKVSIQSIDMGQRDPCGAFVDCETRAGDPGRRGPGRSAAAARSGRHRRGRQGRHADPRQVGRKSVS
jgi:hypothetical protein